MTERLYYEDAFLTSFEANVVEVAEGGQRIYLDRTAFYPSSGGQPFDTGTLGGSRVVDVVDEDDRIAHLLATPILAASVAGAIDWRRRYDHMQQHTGQHLLSGVFDELFGIPTLSFHLGDEVSTIEIGVESLSHEQIAAAELRANEVAGENRPVTCSYEDAEAARGLRKESSRTGMLRIVTIAGLDRSACGGTHVRSTAAAGPILLRRTERIRGNLRLEFLCGQRAVRRSRREFETLSEVSRALTVSAEDTPAVVRANLERLQAAERERRKLALEIAEYHGISLYQTTMPNAAGYHVLLKEVAAIDEEVRALAQSFAKGNHAVFVALASDSAALLLATSQDSGIPAGELLRAALAPVNGRGGGNARMAQGSAGSPAALAAVAVFLRKRLGD